MTDEAWAAKALADWTAEGTQPDGLDGNDAWEWAANQGTEACERLGESARLLAAAVHALRECERHVGEDGNPFERIPEILAEARAKGVPL